MTPPTTYAEWIVIMDMFNSKADDEGSITAMQHGMLNWQSGVAERFTKKLLNVVNNRLNLASDKFQRDMSHANGQERLITEALLQLRTEIRKVAAITKLEVIPEKYREEYGKLIKEHADKIQNSLESSARCDRSGRLLSIVRNYKINIL